MATATLQKHMEYPVCSNTSGYRDFITCTYKELPSEYPVFDGWKPQVKCMINGQFWCGGWGEIRIFDENRWLIKKIRHQQVGDVQGITYTQTGEIIVSSNYGLHKLNSAGNYVRKLTRGCFGRSFSVGESLYVVDVENFSVLTLKYVNGQWKSMSEISLPFDDINGILIKEPGIYISSRADCCIYHFSLIGDFLQRVEAPQSDYDLDLHGVDAYGNMLIVCSLDLDYKVQLFTTDKQWLDVPFLSELCLEDMLESLWCEGDDVFVLIMGRDDYTLLRFTKEVAENKFEFKPIKSAMATATLQKHMECPVCFDLFRNPHVLRCLHTYCLGCLERLQKYGGKIECPECRQITHFKDIKKDFRIEGMVDSFGQLEKGISKDLSSLSLNATPSKGQCLCNNVSKSVVGHCDDCKEYLCSDCKAAHENLKQTSTHNIKSITSVITNLRQDLHNATDDLLKEITTIDLMSAEIDSKIHNIRLDEKNKLAEVHQVLDSLIKAIEKHRKTLVNKITETDGYLVKKLSAKQEKLKSNRLVLQSWLEYLGNVMKSEDVAVLSDVINLHGTTLAGNTGEIAEIGREVKKINIAKNSVMQLVNNYDVMDLESIINVEVEEGFHVDEDSASASVEVSDMKTSGYHDFITCTYKEVASENSVFDGWTLRVKCMINDQLWCGILNEIRIFDQNHKLVKKIRHKNIEEVTGISYTHTGDVIVSSYHGLHKLDPAGKYVRTLQRGCYGKSFAVGEYVYVVDVKRFSMVTLKYVYGQWKCMNEIGLPFDNLNDILIKESGIYICCHAYDCIYHCSLKGDLLQEVEAPRAEDGSETGPIQLLGVDDLGNMLISYTSRYDYKVQFDYKVQLFTTEKQWLDVPFLKDLCVEEIKWLWFEGDDVCVIIMSPDDNRLDTLLRFTKE